MPAADLDLTNAALQAAMANDIAELRSRFPETRALYREVCGLLFFRYGVTPTANKLYSLVRKGSMGAPSEVLQAFWQELRERTRVTIDHPDLPDALKEIAAGAVQTIWQAANEAATGELATLRAEARHAAIARGKPGGPPPSGRRTRRPKPGWKRGGRNWTPPGGSWRSCAPNSRPSWSAPASR